MILVTLDQAKAHLRVDTDAEDDDITLKLQAASAAVIAYLRSYVNIYDFALDVDGVPVQDDAGNKTRATDVNDAFIVSANVQAATLLMLGYLYRNRDENPDNEFTQGYLPAPVTALLYPLRDPAIA